METSTLFQQGISKKQFFADVEMAKKVVNSGFTNHFILLGSTSFKDTRTIGGTTLSDIKECYNGIPIYKDFRFAIPHYDSTDVNRVTATSIVIRDLTKKDRSKLRQAYKFFPSQTYVAELTEPDGFTLLIPFKQNRDGSLVPLMRNNIYRQTKLSGADLNDLNSTLNETLWQEAERIIELLPDLMDSLLAVVKYKGVDMCIPIEKTTAKKTFRTREKDGERRSHLVHNVKQFSRKNLKNVDAVKSHLRGRSEFVIDGIEVCLMGSTEWSVRYATEKHGLKNIGVNS